MLTKARNARYTIPFGPFLSLGAVVFMLYGGNIIYRFLSFVAGR
jgi:prepilin signal peptidase PulO-like enzyme (type II secretory pathway)